jgi:hypothetical protein
VISYLGQVKNDHPVDRTAWLQDKPCRNLVV